MNILSLISTGEKVAIKKQTKNIIVLKLIERKKHILVNGTITPLTRIIHRRNANQILNGYDELFF